MLGWFRLLEEGDSVTRHLLLASLLAVVTGCFGSPAATFAQNQGQGRDSLAAKAGSFTAGTSGSYTYKLYKPDQGGSDPLPLVVMLHGCGQNPDVFARSTQMNAIAQSTGFAVLYPEQSVAAHPRQCWRWFDPDDQSRGHGEPAILNGMVDEIAKRENIDRKAVYVAGLSAGAAMAVILAATYPDTFAAAGAQSGLEYLAATNEGSAWMAMSLGGPDPAPLARKIVDQMGANSRVMPLMVFHGGADYVVKAVNADQIVSQFAKVDDAILRQSGASLSDKPAETRQGRVPGGHNYSHAVYKDSTGRVVLEKYLVNEMSHAWSGGAQGGSFADPKGPDASRLLWDFFKTNRRK